MSITEVRRCTSVSLLYYDIHCSGMNAFIIGAGFTKAAIPDSPLNDELIEALARKKPNSAAQVLGDSYGTNKIEVALTKFDCDNPCATDLRRELEKELGDYFSRFCASENSWRRTRGFLLLSIRRLRREMLSLV